MISTVGGTRTSASVRKTVPCWVRTCVLRGATRASRVRFRNVMRPWANATGSRRLPVVGMDISPSLTAATTVPGMARTSVSTSDSSGSTRTSTVIGTCVASGDTCTLDDGQTQKATTIHTAVTHRIVAATGANRRTGWWSRSHCRYVRTVRGPSASSRRSNNGSRIVETRRWRGRTDRRA